ncbi:hypothetical protein TGRUB_319680 [Toxoplasma gondii RUB]|uniref:Uncharacterized protein n=2 Tax=Toxoplasma gondii TaxID=5811 RepID=A0A086LPY6_TOXGO|nr:hypothetical protein TGRUB_319680 [Toxoplasma gondii RUB]RQX67618.1 hypothetical protein TGCAST_319680 [Toxoplasma gondii CAST]
MAPLVSLGAILFSSAALGANGLRVQVSSTALSEQTLLPISGLSNLPIPGISDLPLTRFNPLVWLTNIIFPKEAPRFFRTYFTAKGCPTWYVDPNRPPTLFDEDFVVTNGWSYDPASGTVDYHGFQEMVEPAHPFPFVFLPQRASSRAALIKRNYLCQNSRIQTEVLLGSAHEAGVIFRGIGERNFWTVLLTAGNGLQLVRVKDGERLVLASIPYMNVMPGQWYSVAIEEQLGDIRMTGGVAGQKQQSIMYQAESDEEFSPRGRENDFLLMLQRTSTGTSPFNAYVNRDRATTDGHRQGTGNPQGISRQLEVSQHLTGTLGQDAAIIKELPEDVKNWCPEGARCAGGPFED